MPPRTYLATASAVVNAGARPVFADVDRDSQNLTAATVAAALTPATKAILCVHLGGWPCDMDALGALVPAEARVGDFVWPEGLDRTTWTGFSSGLFSYPTCSEIAS